MKVVETRPGKTYAVECVGEVTVTNTRTGAVVATGDGSGQVYFVAADLQYTFSDATAIVTELFKLAPRLRLTLLQGVAGGWLPTGFTELEYLESSGTQYIDLDWFNPATYKGRILFVLPTNNDSLSGVMGVCGGQYSPPVIVAYNWGQSVMQRRGNGEPTIMYNQSGWSPDVVFGELNDVVIDVKNYSWNGQKFLVPEDFVYDKIKMMLFAVGERSIARFFSVAVKVLRFAWADESHNYDLFPVLDTNGTPCMFDKISRACFYNAGSGTFGYRIKRTGETTAPMSLRDPYYVAPSGVYARVNGENALEIVADTEEITGEGWEWFANTAEAYAHFGIMPEEKKNF